MIGEMRDAVSISTAMTAAETGHLVLTTLHTPSAAGTIERIVGSFDGARQPQVVMQLAQTLQSVIAQRLVPSADRKRRIPAMEILLANDAVRGIIREGRLQHLNNVITTSRGQGMQTMDQSLSDLVKRGLVTHDDALAASVNPAELRSLLGTKYAEPPQRPSDTGPGS